MNPFDLPPSTPPVHFEPPLTEPSPTGRRAGVSRRRTLAVALASAGITAGAIVAVGSFAGGSSAPQLVGAAPLDSVPPTAAPTTAPSQEPTGEPSDTTPGEPGGADGTIVIRIGDGEPITIDLDDLPSWFDVGTATPGDGADAPSLGNLDGCFGDLFGNLFDGSFDGSGDLGGLPLGDLAGVGTHVTVLGPDGVSIIEFGDGNGSVTITQTDGELNVTSDGDVTTSALDQVLDFGSMPPVSLPDLGELPDFAEIQACLSADQ